MSSNTKHDLWWYGLYASVGFVTLAVFGLLQPRYCADWHQIPKIYKCSIVEFVLKHGG